ncbi:MAG: right-handed parallel beta-helix repeat-containing protein, partial [Phycisphaerales bacterium]|nr:right-handed parallel beta-helix repeat-containing protein [Phycisphaerales bacterium]
NPGGKAITIQGTLNGDGTLASTIDANGGGRVFIFNSGETTDTVIKDLVITGGSASNGGGIFCELESSPTISGCTITGNTATESGGGIYSNSSNPTITNTVLCENTPDNVYGRWSDGGDVCIAFSCQDSDGNGVPDECQGSTGNGIHEVPSEYATIQEAINIAGYGDTILVAPGTYTGTGDWVINTLGKPMTIRATGSPEETILDGEGMRRVVQFSGGEGADTIIKGFTITGGWTSYGGGIYCTGSNPTITDCTISGNSADYGGGIYCNWYSSPAISGCPISGNTASVAGGGIYCDSSSPTITGCTIEGNTVNSYGGGIYCYLSNPTISGCTITGNTSEQGGGGIFCDYISNPFINSCTISGNTAKSGGGIFCYYLSNPTISGGIICGNAPDQIEGPHTADQTCIDLSCGPCHDSDGDHFPDYLDQCPGYDDYLDADGDGIPDDCDPIFNLALGDSISDAIASLPDGSVIELAAGTYYEANLNPGGKAITIQGTLNGDGTLASTIDAQQGGSVFIFSSGETTDTVIKDLVITGGSAGLGGGIYCYNTSSPTITSCTITGNTATEGGGIYCNHNSYANISGCTIEGNAAERGGGIVCDNNSSPTISGCTIEGNTVDVCGGAIYCVENSSPTITSCMIKNNTAVDWAFGWGGGIYCWSSSPQILNCTITGNTATREGGGIYSSFANPNISGGIICGNAPNQIEGPHTANQTCIDLSCGPCHDSDGDHFPDYLDQCPGYDDNLDADGDGTADGCDAFPNDPNEWADSDGDGVGDNQDQCPGYDDNADADGDGTADSCDAFPNDPNEWADTDGDGTGDNADPIFNLALGDSISDAIASAADGVVIELAAGTYYEANLNPGGKAITIQGILNEDGTLASTIDANGGGRVFTLSSGETTDTVIKDLVITGGSAGLGGG